MKFLSTVSIALLFTAAPGPGAATPYYVDFDRGNDRAVGTSPAAPWQHAPGDPAATDTAAGARLRGGDTVYFKGGVAYRGTIVAGASGSPGSPLTYAGTGYGAGAAIFEGADPVTSMVPCPSSTACGGAANWQRLSLVSFTPPATGFIKLYDDRSILVEAQTPASTDPFFSDDVGEFAISPLSEKAMIESGRLRAPALARLLGGVPRGTLQIWTFGNLVVRRPVTGIDGDTLLFDPQGITLYSDRPGRYALIGLASAINAPGQYVVAGTGRAVVWPRPGVRLWVGNGRNGFDLRNRSNIVISGFTFRHQTAGERTAGQGAPIVRGGTAASGLTITGNRFENSALWNGQGVITLSAISDAVVSNNVISMIERGSGIRAAGLSRLKLTGNRIESVGRTGIAFLGVSDSEITGNVITDLHGVHGNGISLYLDNRRIRVTDNRIDTTNRPMTFHGDKSRPMPGNHDFTIERNIFMATDNAQAALTSWGYETRGVGIRNNVLIGPKGGLLTNVSDLGVTITGNYMSGIITYKGEGRGWTIANNRTASHTLRLASTDNNAVRNMCTAAGVPRGLTLGGLPC